MIVPAVKQPEKELREPRRVLAYQCKCGCEFFRVDVEIYADYGWAQVLSCISCGQINEPTEPMTNGPH